MTISEKDITQVFEDILTAEENVNEEVEFEQSASQSNSQGYHISAEVWWEMGYYAGVIECLSHNMKNSNTQFVKKADKIERLVKQMKEMIENFQKENVDSGNMVQLVDNIRVKFKKLGTLIQKPIIYQTENLATSGNKGAS